MQKTLELKDPGHTRQVNTIPMPYQKSLSRDQLFSASGADYKLLLKFLKREGKLSKPLFLDLVKKTKSIVCILLLTQRWSRIPSKFRIR